MTMCGFYASTVVKRISFKIVLVFNNFGVYKYPDIDQSSELATKDSMDTDNSTMHSHVVLQFDNLEKQTTAFMIIMIILSSHL